MTLPDRAGGDKPRAVSPARPCPVCGGADGCSEKADGLILCRRRDGAVPGFRCLGCAKGDPQWFLFRRDGDGPAPAAAPRKRRPAAGPPPDMARIVEECRGRLTPALRDELAAALGLPAFAPAALPGIGYAARGPHRGGAPCWTFPERDGAGNVVGALCRDRDGNKRAWPHRRRGLIYAANWWDGDGPVYLPEGPSDVLALRAAGLSAVGRPSNRGGVGALADLLRGLPPDRPAVVLGENDDKADGKWPGKEGAVATAADLARLLPGRTILWALPPGGAKDARAWFHANGPGPDRPAGEWADAGRRFAEALRPDPAATPSAGDGDLARLPDVLAEGGAAALFDDRPLLEALARLADADPAAYAARRAALKGKVSLPDLTDALRPLRRAQIRERPPVLLAEAGYRVEGSRLCREHTTRDGGAALTPLCNFTAHITEAVVRDDGAERAGLFTLAGELDDGRELPPVQVPEADFAGMDWVTTAWHGEAVVYAGQGTRDHLRAAVQLLSAGRVRRTEYAHAGWRDVNGAWHYLHAGGAIGPDGPVDDIRVSLPDALAGFRLPEPPAGGDRAAAVRLSLALLDGPARDRIMFPLLAAVYRAALGDAPGPVDLALFLVGPHGVGKSELAALCQQHYGAGMDRLHLPGNWSSTANATEALAFAAKDALIVVDDYAPRGPAADRQRLERDADRLIRAQGNRAGRQRMTADGGLRPTRPPRGLILCTGEDVPSGQSLRGRMLVVEVSPADVQLPGLTTYQNNAAAGRYAQALAGFVHWLAPHYGELRERLPGERAALRERATAAPGGSPRTPGAVADLALGLKVFLDFAEAAGAVGGRERAALEERGWKALNEATAAQAEQAAAAEPAGHFLRLLAAALASGRAHVAGPDGGKPDDPAAWGWPAGEARPGGRCVGWLDGADLYLEPEASYAAAAELAREQGGGLAVSPQTLRKRLRERGLLASAGGGGRETLTVRRTLAGRRREVLHLRADALSPSEKPDQPDQPGPDPAGNGHIRGQVAGQVPGGRAADLTTKLDQNAPENGHWSGWSGFLRGGRGGATGDDGVNPSGKGDAWEGD